MPEARHEVVVITGASAGIGRAARIALIARDPARLEAARAQSELGPIDIQVNNRGTTVQVSSALAYRSIPLRSPYCEDDADASRVAAGRHRLGRRGARPAATAQTLHQSRT